MVFNNFPHPQGLTDRLGWPTYWPGIYGIGGRWLEDEYSPYGHLDGVWYFDDYQDLNIIVPEHEIYQGVSHLSTAVFGAREWNRTTTDKNGKNGEVPR